MIPKERLLGVITGSGIDRIPAVPLIGNFAGKISGYKVSEIARDGIKLAKAIEYTYKKMNPDLVTILTDLCIEAEAMGCELEYFDNDVPIVKKHVSLEEISIPDPEKDGRMPEFLKCIEYLVEKIGNEVFIGMCVPGPFTIAGNLHGTESMMMDLVMNPDVIKEEIKLATEASKLFINACMDRGAIPLICDPIASGSLISPKFYEEFALNPCKEIVKEIHKRGLPAILHICGDVNPILELMVKTGADFLSVDANVNLKEMKEKVGKNVGIIGNIDPGSTIYLGSKEDVLNECKKAIEYASDNPKGYILASGCEIPLASKEENVKAIVEAAELYGEVQ
ncbi:uroporphyrinogen decarboxylase family protein [Methanotorris igneus]|uniref:Uroporphyrinogen decarboxylase (URO-D) n=1 Tax=Methanotorris igneus (strain DSM 5666 / JCM 11834 / Kol 5) TaxID=880724 RepID=F6BCL6_METIK|nr:uroporphyrinogen decarboxylase family protein [Methanotorris igneus]AEF96227.1 Uroporphyrinogen decarboxylase (URO-D) [Methanotorris igneus Kol 5]